MGILNSTTKELGRHSSVEKSLQMGKIMENSSSSEQLRVKKTISVLAILQLCISTCIAILQIIAWEDCKNNIDTILEGYSVFIIVIGTCLWLVLGGIAGIIGLIAGANVMSNEVCTQMAFTLISLMTSVTAIVPLLAIFQETETWITEQKWAY